MLLLRYFDTFAAAADIDAMMLSSLPRLLPARSLIISPLRCRHYLRHHAIF